MIRTYVIFAISIYVLIYEIAYVIYAIIQETAYVIYAIIYCDICNNVYNNICTNPFIFHFLKLT